ncbi:hypothetical protein [Marinobacter goseongensis]|uniref:hypothetical protein n=1 Tax=Marinobacter goseongensis TaxID=453838 RepID=UPI0020044119|nr:hypothetical protein [Marinobacter goseongensis]MCK7552811.1 hypothetical protein [Marinobacter goseongensis]
MGHTIFEFSVEFGSFTLTMTGYQNSESFVGHMSMTFEDVRLMTEDDSTVTVTRDCPSVYAIVTAINDNLPSARNMGLNVFEAANLLAARWPAEARKASTQSS